MLTRRERQIAWGGALIGLAAGLIGGFWALAAEANLFMHHMFILGIRWSAPGLWIILLLPVLLLVAGIWLLRSRRHANG